MYYKKRKMDQQEQQQQQQQNETTQPKEIDDKNQQQVADLSHQFCFVHRIAGLPLVAYSVEQVLHYYDKTKKTNRLIAMPLNLAENTVKYAAAKVEPIRRLLDGPIVTSNKIACNQLEKLEERFPIIQITPDELLQHGKAYYDKSWCFRTGFDTAQAVIVFGGQKVQSTLELADRVFSGVLYVGSLRPADLIRLSGTAVNETLIFSDSLIDAYIAPPAFQQNGPPAIQDASVVARIYRMSTKVVCGLKYKAETGLELTRDQAYNLLGQMQAALYLVEYAKNTVSWMTEEAIAKLSAAPAQVAALLSALKATAEQFGRQPDVALLNLVKQMSTTFATMSDYLDKYSSAYMPENLYRNVAIAVRYAHEMSDTFNKATTLGELRDEVVKEAKDKFLFMQAVFSSVVDRLVVYPPICWLGFISRTVADSANKNIANGVVSDGVRETDKNK